MNVPEAPVEHLAEPVLLMEMSDVGCHPCVPCAHAPQVATAGFTGDGDEV